jgi:hypothetical protein
MTARVRKQYELARLREAERDALNPKEDDKGPELIVIRAP